MSASKKEILADLKYCKESLDRIIKYTERGYFEDALPWGNHHTVIQSDIIKLRRELNEVKHKLAWEYVPGRSNK